MTSRTRRFSMPQAACAVAAAVALAMPGPAWATPQSDTLRLGEAVAAARGANPMLRAARLRADAALERVPQAGALPDPRLSLGLMNRPLDFGGSEPMTMNSVQWTQELPWPGKLGFASDRATYLAAADSLDADEAERRLIARVKGVYYDIAYMDRAISIMSETRELLRGFLDVSATMYQVGTGLQQDVLQAQVAVAKMTEDITVMEQNRIAMAARLNALMDRVATALVPALELPPPSQPLPPVDVLLELAGDGRPSLAAARRRAQAAEAGYRAARRELYPDIMVSLAYGERPAYDDMVTLMVGFSIPLWAGGRQLPLRREMLAMQSMAEAEERDLYNETLAQITELRAEAQRAQSLTDLYANAIVPQARAAVESAFSAYRVGRVDYMTLVENEMTVNRYEIERIRLAADFHRAVAELEALAGEGLGGER